MIGSNIPAQRMPVELTVRPPSTHIGHPSGALGDRVEVELGMGSSLVVAEFPEIERIARTGEAYVRRLSICTGTMWNKYYLSRARIEEWRGVTWKA